MSVIRVLQLTLRNRASRPTQEETCEHRIPAGVILVECGEHELFAPLSRMKMQPREALREDHETEPSMISGERENPGSHSNPRLRQRLIAFHLREERVTEQRIAKMAGGGTDCFVGPPTLLSSALGRGVGSKCVDQFA